MDRIENPGQRRKTSLKFPQETPNVGRQPGGSQPFEEGSRRKPDVVTGISKNAMDRQQPDGEVRRVSVPVISVNDKPVNRGTRATEKRAGSVAGNFAQPNRRPSHHMTPRTGANGDYTTASAGMFSDCMFGETGHKPTPSVLSKRSNRSESTSSSSASSSSSIHTHGGHKSDYKTEQSKRMPTVATEVASQAPSSLQVEAALNRYSFHNRNPNPNPKLHKGKQGSFSTPTSNDGKRLVNQFLRSMDVAPNASGFHFGKPDKITEFSANEQSLSANTTDFDLPTNGSLQNLLYRDLDSLRRNKNKQQQVPRSPYGQGQAPSSSETSSQFALYNQGTPGSSSNSFDTPTHSTSVNESEKSVAMKRNGSLSNGVFLNYNEVDYYRRHIGSELHKFEEILKHNLKTVIMKNEHDMEKNLSNFDLLTAELSRLKNRASALHDQIANNDLVKLRKDFEKNDKDSFLEVLTTSTNSNAEKLEELEKRINICKQKLFQQRDTLRKLEGLLTLEDSLLDSKKTSNVAYRYRYIVIDIGVMAALIGFSLLVKWLFWNHY